MLLLAIVFVQLIKERSEIAQVTLPLPEIFRDISIDKVSLLEV